MSSTCNEAAKERNEDHQKSIKAKWAKAKRAELSSQERIREAEIRQAQKIERQAKGFVNGQR